MKTLNGIAFNGKPKATAVAGTKSPSASVKRNTVQSFHKSRLLLMLGWTNSHH
jgi:hypothetical protein